MIEHNLEVVKIADWPSTSDSEGGDAGGEIVATGTPEDIAGQAELHGKLPEGRAETRQAEDPGGRMRQ